MEKSVASAVEEMTVNFKRIEDNSGQASEVAKEANVLAETANEKMSGLNEAGPKIGSVTEVIKRIAEQTNLLALNATIEAASAGEAGKGFAVVASEIKELANQSAKAAEDIATMIEGVQDNTKASVDVITKVSTIIETINESIYRIDGVWLKNKMLPRRKWLNVAESSGCN